MDTRIQKIQYLEQVSGWLYQLKDFFKLVDPDGDPKGFDMVFKSINDALEKYASGELTDDDLDVVVDLLETEISKIVEMFGDSAEEKFLDGK